MVGEFGDDTLNNFDLITALRAVTAIPGFVPPACADRFDAMDAYPPDGATRGGDFTLNNFDLIATLRRVTGIDTTRPRRTSRGPCTGGPEVGPARRRGQGLELADDGAGRVAVYAALPGNATVSFGLRLGPGRFVPAVPPTLLDTGVPGFISAAWLDGLSTGRVLLGWVEGTSAGEIQPMGVEINTAGRTYRLDRR